MATILSRPHKTKLTTLSSVSGTNLKEEKPRSGSTSPTRVTVRWAKFSSEERRMFVPRRSS